MPGYNDLVAALPRSPGLPISVLIPQRKGWHVANYLLIVYSWDIHRGYPSFKAHVHSTCVEKFDTALEDTSAFDNPDNAQFPDPPADMIDGYHMSQWKSYWQNLVSLNAWTCQQALITL